MKCCHPAPVAGDNGGDSVQMIQTLGLSVTAGAGAPGVTQVTLSKPINGQSGISPEIAMRPAKAFGGSAETWSGHADRLRPDKGAQQGQCHRAARSEGGVRFGNEKI